MGVKQVAAVITDTHQSGLLRPSPVNLPGMVCVCVGGSVPADGATLRCSPASPGSDGQELRGGEGGLVELINPEASAGEVS